MTVSACPWGRPRQARCLAPPRHSIWTGDAELLARLSEMEITRLCAEVDPPPNTRHIAVRTGKRYGKTSLTARHGRDLARAISECRYLLRERGSGWRPEGLRARGAHHVQGLQARPGRGAGHPGTPHRPFLALRGSIALEDCDVLLVVGTPTLRPEDLARLARAYYHADPLVIDETSVRGEDGRWRYRDRAMRAEWPMRSPGRSSPNARTATGRCATMGGWS